MSNTGNKGFRCPECWRAYNSATSLHNHRAKSQGECIMFSLFKPHSIATYRKHNKIAKRLPLPERETT